MRPHIIRVAADGSAGSKRALEWALEEAQLRHCAVEIVAAYEVAEGTAATTARDSAERSVHATMDDLVAGRVDLPTVSWHVVEGHPADVLVRESAQSQLLVMGSHGVGGMIHSAQTSVADVCSRMADCPVVVIPAAGWAASPRDELTRPSTA